MAEYIHEIQNTNMETLPTAISVIDVTSPLNKSFIEQVKRDHSIYLAYGERLNTVHSQATGYFSHFTNTHARVDKLMITLESKMNSWESEKIRWDEYIIGISKVQEYRLAKLLM